MTHPFAGTPQYEQIYGNRQGPPIGQPGNGLGDTWGGCEHEDDDGNSTQTRRSRLATILRSVDEGDGEEHVDPDEVVLLAISSALNRLTTRQGFVIGLRFGLRDGNEYTQQEIAELMGVSRQAVARLEERAIERLRVLVEGE
jgi:RNA polymerase sigma factor (sigma-70 family)